MARCVLACGFDPDTYLDKNTGLREAGLDTQAALCHFLEHGYAEHRTAPTGPLPQGLDVLAGLPIPDRTYWQTLFKTLFLTQARHPGSAERLWAGIDTIHGMGGRPYVVFGDSHAHHYVRKEKFGSTWLAAMPLVCHGASAGSLTHGDPFSKEGAAIMRWAEANARLKLPIFLKFGGLDAEFRWVAYRIRHNIVAFSGSQFDEYAGRAILQYGTFLDHLDAVAGSDRLEIPDFATRTRLRGRFNARLREVCEAKGLAFVDAFTPFLTARGGTDRRYLACDRDSADYYMDHETIGAKLAPLIHRLAAG